MSSVWARVKPLLARVHKPARYIGCEDGAIPPRHEAFGPAGPVAWLFAYPDSFEIGLPDQGLQIRHELLNERDDAVADTGATWRDSAVRILRPHYPNTHQWTNNVGHRREVLPLPADVNAPDLRVCA